MYTVDLLTKFMQMLNKTGIIFLMHIFDVTTRSSIQKQFVSFIFHII